MPQIDEILDRANKDAAGPNDFARALWQSKEVFMEDYETSEGIWVPVKKSKR